MRYNSTVTIEELTGLPIRDIELPDEPADNPANPPVEAPPVPVPIVPPPIEDHEGQLIPPHAKEAAPPPQLATLIGALLAFGIPPPLPKSMPACPPMPTTLPPTPMPKVLSPQEAMAPPPVKSGHPHYAPPVGGLPGILAQLDRHHMNLYQGIVAGFIVPKAKSPPGPKAKAKGAAQPKPKANDAVQPKAA